MTAFHVIGIVFFVWALVISVLGIKRENFPASAGAERLVAVISVVLAILTIGSGIYVAANEEEEEEGAGEAALVLSHR